MKNSKSTTLPSCESSSVVDEKPKLTIYLIRYGVAVDGRVRGALVVPKSAASRKLKYNTLINWPTMTIEKPMPGSVDTPQMTLPDGDYSIVCYPNKLKDCFEPVIQDANGAKCWFRLASPNTELFGNIGIECGDTLSSLNAIYTPSQTKCLNLIRALAIDFDVTLRVQTFALSVGEHPSNDLVLQMHNCLNLVCYYRFKISHFFDTLTHYYRQSLLWSGVSRQDTDKYIAPITDIYQDCFGLSH